MASVSTENVWQKPLWAWRQYVTWQDGHLETYKNARKQGVHCVNC